MNVVPTIGGSQTAKVFEFPPISIGPFEVRYAAVAISLGDGKSLVLSPKERLLLGLLLLHVGEYVSRETIRRYVWPNYKSIDTRDSHTLETHICRLRRKFERCGLKTVIDCGDDNSYGLFLSASSPEI